MCETCSKKYTTDSGLRRHYRKYTEHHVSAYRPQGGNIVAPAKEQVQKFLDVANKYKFSRIKELFNSLGDKDVHECILPLISKRITLYNLFGFQCSLSTNGNENVPSTSSALKAKLLSFATLVNDNFHNEFAYVLNCLGYTKVNNSNIHGTRIPLTPLALQSNISNASQTLTTASGRTLNLQNRRLIPFVNDLAIDNLSLSSRTQIIHSLLKLSVKQISEKFSNDLAKNSYDIVTHLDLSRRDYQLILRNSVGKQIEDIVGCNPFVSRHLMEQNLREKSKHLKSNFDLQFAESNGTVVGYTNIQKYLQWILGKKSLQDIVKTPIDAIVVYFYVDLFPWLSWSRFFTGKTTIRMKILEPKNTLRSIATVAAWFGPDTNECVSSLGKFVFSQMHCLSAISHPLKGNQISLCSRSGRWCTKKKHHRLLFCIFLVSHTRKV